MHYTFKLDPLIDQLRSSNKYWKSFFEKDKLELGILRLGIDEKDDQSPHASDEIYLILSGNGFLHIAGYDYEITKHTVYFVPKNTIHYFHSNTEEIIAFYTLT